MSWISTIGSSPWTRLIERLTPRQRASTQTPIVPPGSVSGHALTVVIGIMCFLACLTVGAVYMVNQSASAWFEDIASEVTVQLNPAENVNLDKQVTLVALYLAKQPGIRKVVPLTAEASSELLEPWLGRSDALSALPVPRLIAVEIDRSKQPNLAAIRNGLKAAFPNVALDDHRRWQAQIRTVTRSLALGGIAVLILVAAATVATIVSATRSAMASNREIIEVLHLVGAKESFIAHEFEKHFLAVGIRAGMLGALAATIVFMLLPVMMQLLGSGTFAAAEFKRLIGPAVLDLTGYLWLALVIVVVAILCMMTSRYGVFRILKANE